jgi:hypothetical protein
MAQKQSATNSRSGRAAISFIPSPSLSTIYETPTQMYLNP